METVYGENEQKLSNKKSNHQYTEIQLGPEDCRTEDETGCQPKP